VEAQRAIAELVEQRAIVGRDDDSGAAREEPADLVDEPRAGALVDVAGLGRVDAGEHAQERGLAGAVLADEREGRAAGDVEVERSVGADEIDAASREAQASRADEHG
jgi:hypothetical protein